MAPLLRSHHDSSHKQSCLFFKVEKSKESVYRPNAPVHQAAGWWAGQADAQTGSKTETYRTQKTVVSCLYIFKRMNGRHTPNTEDRREPRTIIGPTRTNGQGDSGPRQPHGVS